MPLYDGGTRRALVDQAKLRADDANAILDRLAEEAAHEVAKAGNTLRTSLAAYLAATELRAAAQVTYDAALAAYRNGVGPITDATVAETGRLHARDAATDAYCQSLAAATLALTTGALGAAPE